MLLSFIQAIHSVSVEFFFLSFFSLNNRSWTFFLLADVYVISSLFMLSIWVLICFGSKLKPMCLNVQGLLPVPYFAENGIAYPEVRDIWNVYRVYEIIPQNSCRKRYSRHSERSVALCLILTIPLKAAVISPIPKMRKLRLIELKRRAPGWLHSKWDI